MTAGSEQDSGTAQLGAEVGEAMGFIAPSDSESPGTTSDAPASAPAEGTTETPASAASDTPADDVRPDTPETPAASADATPTATPEPDPLATATPITYQVDGRTASWDKIKVLGEDGAVIQAADLPDVMRRLSERDHYVEQNKTLFREHDALTKLTTWKTTNAEGKEQTYTGPTAVVESRASAAADTASLKVLAEALLTPELFRELVAVDKDNQIVLNPSAFRSLETRVELAAERASRGVRDTLSRDLVQYATPAPAAPDYASEVPALVQQVAKAAGLDAAKLSPEDTALLAEHLPFHVKEGVVSEAWQKLARTALTRSTQSAASVKVVTEAAKLNAAKLAQAAQPKKAAPPPKPVVPSKAKEVEQAHSDSWDSFERAAAKALRATAV